MLPIFLTIEDDNERLLAEDLYLAYKSRITITKEPTR